MACTFRGLKNVGIVVPFGMCDIFNRETSLVDRIKQIESYGEGLLSNADDEGLAAHACDDIQEIIKNNPLPEKFIVNALARIDGSIFDDFIAVSALVLPTTMSMIPRSTDGDVLRSEQHKSYQKPSRTSGHHWTIEAVKHRAMHNIKQYEASVSVVLRRANHFERSFVVSIGKDDDQIREIRLRVGLRARPRFDEDEWTMTVQPENSDDAFETVTFANISEASRSRKTAPWFGTITSERVLYSREPLSLSKNER